MSSAATTLADDPGLLSVANMLMRRYGDARRFSSTDTVDHTMRVLYHALAIAEGTTSAVDVFRDTKDPRILEVVNEILSEKILAANPANMKEKEAAGVAK